MFGETLEDSMQLAKEFEKAIRQRGINLNVKK